MAMSLKRAPEYKAHRLAIDAVDSPNPTDSIYGIQCREFDRLHVQVHPSGGANPSVEVVFWSDALQTFISAHTSLTFAGKGADTPYEFSVDVEGRIAFVRVAAIVAGACDVYVAGWHASA